MSLSEDEKVRARRHLGYLNVQNAATFVLGVPAGVETQFMIEGALNRILPAAEYEFRRLLSKLDVTEDQIFDDQDVLVITRIDEININKDEFSQLLERYMFWRASLGNLLGITPNPFDQRFSAHGGGGHSLNVPVNQ